MNKLAYLENAHKIGYELVLNELWTARFRLPADDPKNIYCSPFNLVEIFDGGERIELFRIMPSTLTRDTSGTVEYQCEHVLATLLDDVLFQYHQIGNIGVGTTTVLRYILDRQLIKRWQLGQCEFDRRFEYKWENENLLSALFSVPQPFNEKYRWEFDTTGSTWRINLKQAPTSFKADLTYRKNMLEIEKEVDPTRIVTRLYCLGYGEGDNQLGIESVNSGLPYLQANGESTTWGIKSSILVDRRFESPETLKAYGQALLNELKSPYKSYSVRAVDLYRQNPAKHEKFNPGDLVRITDYEDDITEVLPIKKVIKNDITGYPGEVEIEIANKTRDVASSITELQNRARINEVYAQGATNQIIIPYADNADQNNPARLRIYIPDTMARINKCIINFQVEPFRAYSKAISGGGASTQTSSSGGGGATTSSSGGGTSTTSGSGGGTNTTSSNDSTANYWNLGGSYSIADVMQVKDGHAHGIVPHNHPHSHSVSIPSHSHSVNVPDHSHNVNIPNHTHSISIPNHTHDLEFGIFQGDIANSVTIKIGNKTITNAPAGQDIDLIPFLQIDGAGKVQRNTWHTVELVPNQMTRVVANVFMQIFTNSRGGGDY